MRVPYRNHLLKSFGQISIKDLHFNYSQLQNLLKIKFVSDFLYDSIFSNGLFDFFICYLLSLKNLMALSSKEVEA